MQGSEAASPPDEGNGTLTRIRLDHFTAFGRLALELSLERLSLQPLLLEHLAERLRRRVKREGPDPWKREYVSACTIVPALDPGRALPGSARRVPA